MRTAISNMIAKFPEAMIAAAAAGVYLAMIFTWTF